MSEIPEDAVEAVDAVDAVDADLADDADEGVGIDAVDADLADDADDDAAPSAPVDSSAAPPAAGEPSSSEVGRALAELGSLDALDLADHPDAYQRIHAELQNALASIDDA